MLTATMSTFSSCPFTLQWIRA